MTAVRKKVLRKDTVSGCVQAMEVACVLMTRSHAHNTLPLQVIEFFSFHFISGPVPVDEFVRLQVVFGYVRMIPLCKKILVKGEIKAAQILIMLKYVFWHPLDI